MGWWEDRKKNKLEELRSQRSTDATWVSSLGTNKTEKEFDKLNKKIEKLEADLDPKQTTFKDREKSAKTAAKEFRKEEKTSLRASEKAVKNTDLPKNVHSRPSTNHPGQIRLEGFANQEQASAFSQKFNRDKKDFSAVVRQQGDKFTVRVMTDNDYKNEFSPPSYENALNDRTIPQPAQAQSQMRSSADALTNEVSTALNKTTQANRDILPEGVTTHPSKSHPGQVRIEGFKGQEQASATAQALAQTMPAGYKVSVTEENKKYSLRVERSTDLPQQAQSAPQPAPVQAPIDRSGPGGNRPILQNQLRTQSPSDYDLMPNVSSTTLSPAQTSSTNGHFEEKDGKSFYVNPEGERFPVDKKNNIVNDLIEKQTEREPNQLAATSKAPQQRPETKPLPARPQEADDPIPMLTQDDLDRASEGLKQYAPNLVTETTSGKNQQQPTEETGPKPISPRTPPKRATEEERPNPNAQNRPQPQQAYVNFSDAIKATAQTIAEPAAKAGAAASKDQPQKDSTQTTGSPEAAKSQAKQEQQKKSEGKS
jgi:hypothetical protein